VSQFVGQMFSQARLPGVLHHLDLFAPAYERQAQLVDIWLEDVAGLPNHPDWRVIASPGHTPESLCLYNPFSHELLCGDTVVTIEGGTTLVRGGIHRRLIRNPHSPHKARLQSKPANQISDLRTAAVNDHGLDPDRFQQTDILREAFTELRRENRMAPILPDERAAMKTRNLGQCLRAYLPPL